MRPAHRGRHFGLLCGLAAFAVLWLVFGWVALQLPTLPDTDSYYHLGVARLYAEDGLVDTLPWARASLLHDGFGDKELLFHVLLMPFAGSSDAPSADGGRWALAFWNALLVTLLGAVAWRFAGAWGLVVPALLWLGSLDFLGRMIRLRPESAALALLVLAALCAGTRRDRTLGAVTFLFTLTYTAFHALLGLCGLWFLLRWADARLGSSDGETGQTTPWTALVYPILGAGLGLLLHPHFPHNLVVWKVQSIDFFAWKGVLDVGQEIRAATTDRTLLQNLPWLLGLVVLAASAFGRRPDSSDASSKLRPTARLEARSFLVAATCFAGLYLLMARFSTHALPLLSLALLATLAARGLRPGSTVPLPRGRSIATAWLLVPILLVGAWRATWLISGLATAGERETEWASFGAAVPEGAKVAAPWGQTPIYLFWGPQGSYLNVLDPVFQAVPFPDLYRLQRDVFEGTEPDVPLAAVAGLDSDHLAVSRILAPTRLQRRLAADPRAEPVYTGLSLLYRFRPSDDAGFVVDWRQVPHGTPLPVRPSQDIDAWTTQPLLEPPNLRALEAYVDGRRSAPTPPGGSACRAWVRDETVDQETPERTERRRYELAPAGPTTLWLDGREVVRILDSQGAILSRGVELTVDLAPGTHRWTVLSCPDDSKGRPDPDRVGFYLLERSGA